MIDLRINGLGVVFELKKMKWNWLFLLDKYFYVNYYYEKSLKSFDYFLVYKCKK